MNLIECRNLALGYNGRAVLKGLNFNVEEGDFICIVGENGSGKTTLIRGLLGLIKPLKGKITYCNLKKNTIGYMPQETHVDAHFPASVFEIVLSGTLAQKHFKPFYTAVDKKNALQKLSLLNIANLKKESFADLSGGQRQKVLLARSLCATSKMIVLDEPSNNLDAHSKAELYQLIIRLNREFKIAVIMVTHDLDHDNLISDKILSLRGKDFFFGSTKEYVRMLHE